MATSTIKKDAPIIKRKSYSKKVSSIGANTTAEISATDLGISVPDGYTMFAVVNFYASDTAVVVSGVQGSRTSGSGTVIYARNVTSSAKSNVTIYYSVAYIRSDLQQAVS